MTLLRSFAFLLLPLGALAQGPAAPAAPVQTGVSAALAAQRAQALRRVAYTLDFVLPGAPTQPVVGLETVRFELRGPTDSLALDFKAPAGAVQRLAVNGKVVPPVQRREHVLIAPGYLRGAPTRWKSASRPAAGR
ncbi:hypothetical protein [Hymenobacter coccineus]|uniref:hypothetical protein n=1 Tax=Hymenobacter coccineus TaxID=1908235 RepID=UPI001EFB1964|nr:hypothetical protein [Hymenobacter coccineus]